jgi:nucleotide-binding universal stress UspA family protein
MKTILVPTDFSDNAHNALRYAANLASQVEAKIILVHIIHLPVAPLESGMVITPDMHLEEDFSLELDSLANNLRQEHKDRFVVETICQYGYLTGDLNDLVKTHQVDLVVMGTLGATNFLDKLMGTNSSEFSKSALCPVLIIPAMAHFEKINHIAYASDFESEEEVFLQQLFGIAQSFKAQVSIVNVMDDQELNILSDTEVVEDITTHFPDIVYSIAQIRLDDVVEGLHAFVEESQADVLAVSIHKRGFFEELFHSSISKKLIYHTTLPLLTLPEKPYHRSWENTSAHSSTSSM